MAATGIAFTMYPVTDLKRAVAFYEEALGLPKSGLDLDYWVEFEVGSGTFGVGNFEQVGTPGTAQSLALEVDDLPAVRARLAKHGVEATEPHDLANCRISVVRDPDGNQVWLHQSKPR
ncbi:MAG TPA: VOC family protein [Candidatus Elarobacter sp.]|jgi:predicted enzyme related to lactoylglutathione lyase